MSSIPSQSTYLGCEFDPSVGRARRRQPINVFLSPSLKSMNLSLSEDFLFFSFLKSCRAGWWWWFHKDVRVLNATELYI